MTNKVSVLLEDEQRGHTSMVGVWKQAKAHLSAGRRMLLTLEPEKRSNPENRLLHSLLGYISTHMEWAGEKHDIETWKRLMTAAWCRATHEQVKILPAIDGCGVDIVFRHTSKLTRGECADLITFIHAWGCMNDVEFPGPKPVNADTSRLLGAP